MGPAPAGSLSASGADMGHFMIAHLQDGKYGAGQILKPETAQMMHTTALTTLPRVNRMVLGFYETNRNGHRVISHGGDTLWFHSDLHLFLDDNVGLLSFRWTAPARKSGLGATSADNSQAVPNATCQGRDFDGKVEPQTAAEHARMMVGVYDNSRRPSQLLQAPEPRRTPSRSSPTRTGRSAFRSPRTWRVRLSSGAKSSRSCNRNEMWQTCSPRKCRTDGSFASPSTDSRRSWCLNQRRS